MESDNQYMESDEESERLVQELYEAQEMVREASISANSEVICKRMVEKHNDSEEEELISDDPALKGSPEEDILKSAEEGRLDNVEKLLLQSANLVKTVDGDGYTPLHRSCYSDHFEIVEVLLKHGADVHARTCDGWTPLHSACKWNNHKCVSLLLDYGSEVNALTNGGQTPLHLASSHPEAKETLFLLLTHPKISINLRNQAGELAFDIAYRHCKYYKLFELCDPSFNTI